MCAHIKYTVDCTCTFIFIDPKNMASMLMKIIWYKLVHLWLFIRKGLDSRAFFLLMDVRELDKTRLDYHTWRYLWSLDSKKAINRTPFLFSSKIFYSQSYTAYVPYTHMVRVSYTVYTYINNNNNNNSWLWHNNIISFTFTYECVCVRVYVYVLLSSVFT